MNSKEGYFARKLSTFWAWNERPSKLKRIFFTTSLPKTCIFLSLFLLFLLFSCGYHCQAHDQQMTVSVPLIKGDINGQLMNEIIHALNVSGHFEYQRNGNMQLIVTILSDSDDRIGYRYDRNPTTGKRRKNIVGTENRETISAEVKLIDSYTQEIIIEPEVIQASADYDYVDSNSIRDLVFFNPDGHPTTVIDFSLGQLDSIEGAHDDARLPIFQKLAQRIVDGLLMQKCTKSNLTLFFPERG